MRSSHALTRRACLATVHSRLSAVALCAQRRVAGAVANTAGSKPWSRAWHGQSPAPRSEVTKRRIRTMPRGRAGVPAAVVLATITVACILQLAVPVNAHEESSQSGGTFHECIHDQIAGAHVPNVAYVATSAGRTAEDDGLFAREALLGGDPTAPVLKDATEDQDSRPARRRLVGEFSSIRVFIDTSRL